MRANMYAAGQVVPIATIQLLRGGFLITAFVNEVTEDIREGNYPLSVTGHDGEPLAPGRLFSVWLPKINKGEHLDLTLEVLDS